VIQQFFEFSPDAILFTDAQGDIRAANRQAKPLYRVARTAMHE
jgi:PAS domain-containing protein